MAISGAGASPEVYSLSQMWLAEGGREGGREGGTEEERESEGRGRGRWREERSEGGRKDVRQKER